MKTIALALMLAAVAGAYGVGRRSAERHAAAQRVRGRIREIGAR